MEATIIGLAVKIRVETEMVIGSRKMIKKIKVDLMFN